MVGRQLVVSISHECCAGGEAALAGADPASESGPVGKVVFTTSRREPWVNSASDVSQNASRSAGRALLQMRSPAQDHWLSSPRAIQQSQSRTVPLRLVWRAVGGDG